MPELFTHFAARRAGAYAPVYEQLAAGIAQDADLLAIAAQARAGQSPPDLFLAAVHLLVMADPVQPLARFYPTLTSRAELAAPQGDLWRLFRDFCQDHRAAISQIVATRLVQTNEIRRCTYLRPALAFAAARRGLPEVALIEVGASAGLNLLMDQYTYRYHPAGQPSGTPARPGNDGRREPGACPIVLTCGLPAGVPAAVAPVIGWRAGLDLNPLKPADVADRSWLRALVWADHPARLGRLTAALQMAADRPPAVYPGDAVRDLPALIAQCPPDLPVVVMHTAMAAHLPAQIRADFHALVPALSADRLLLWVHAEPQSQPHDRLGVSVCRDGRAEEEWRLGDYHPHGQWLAWSPRQP